MNKMDEIEPLIGKASRNSYLVKAHDDIKFSTEYVNVADVNKALNFYSHFKTRTGELMIKYPELWKAWGEHSERDLCLCYDSWLLNVAFADVTHYKTK